MSEKERLYRVMANNETFNLKVRATIAKIIECELGKTYEGMEIKASLDIPQDGKMPLVNFAISAPLVMHRELVAYVYGLIRGLDVQALEDAPKFEKLLGDLRTYGKALVEIRNLGKEQPLDGSKCADIAQKTLGEKLE